MQFLHQSFVVQEETLELLSEDAQRLVEGLRILLAQDHQCELGEAHGIDEPLRLDVKLELKEGIALLIENQRVRLLDDDHPVQFVYLCRRVHRVCHVSCRLQHGSRVAEVLRIFWQLIYFLGQLLLAKHDHHNVLKGVEDRWDVLSSHQYHHYVAGARAHMHLPPRPTGLVIQQVAAFAVDTRRNHKEFLIFQRLSREVLAVVARVLSFLEVVQMVHTDGVTDGNVHLLMRLVVLEQPLFLLEEWQVVLT